MQKRSCDKTGWDSPELKNRIAHIEALPESLTIEELTAVARVVLPDATVEDCEVIASGAVASGKYLVNVENIAKRAKYLAEKSGRIELDASDIEQAILYVGRSDTLLRQTLDQNEPARPGRKPKQSIQPLTASSPRTAQSPSPAPHNRIGQIPAPAPGQQRANITEISPG
jgi:hypothetical protein